MQGPKLRVNTPGREFKVLGDVFRNVAMAEGLKILRSLNNMDPIGSVNRSSSGWLSTTAPFKFRVIDLRPKSGTEAVSYNRTLIIVELCSYNRVPGTTRKMPDLRYERLT